MFTTNSVLNKIILLFSDNNKHIIYEKRERFFFTSCQKRKQEKMEKIPEDMNSFRAIRMPE